eukprot:TRINITY_DN36956_c0_g1_i1.p1 TRINITY_DN36956_c0_g1~~TRINITY_DN36956_c0_g1_i1.p1  ORF type:complete len:102 (+),score=3.44 TRINITY_DN36956_c0_g1_i1:73-378(+)
MDSGLETISFFPLFLSFLSFFLLSLSFLRFSFFSFLNYMCAFPSLTCSQYIRFNRLTRFPDIEFLQIFIWLLVRMKLLIQSPSKDVLTWFICLFAGECISF